MGQPFKTIRKNDSRAYTCAVLELIDEGVLDKDQLIQDLLGWMSEHDVERFCVRNLRDEDNECLIRPEDELTDEEVEDIMNDFNYVGNKSHY